MSKKANIDLLHEIASEKGLSAEGCNLLENIMAVESGGNKNAKNPNSEAYGLFQFIPSTWNKYVKKHPGELTSDGRSDPKQQIIAAISFTQDNEAMLTRALGRSPSSGELYLAHFLGAGGGSEKGAIDVIREAEKNPNTPIKGFLPDKVLEKNGYQNEKNRGVRMKLTDNSELLFKDFTVADINNWASGKMKQPSKYEGVNVARYSKDKNNVPESLGDMVMTIITAALEFISSLIGGAKDFSKMLVSNVSGDSPLPSPNTPVAKLASTNKVNNASTSII